jgi:cytochrome d ubiquinol oxidase subunit II
VAAVIWGWGVAQYSVLLPGTAVTLSNAGAPNDTLVALVVLFIIAVLLIGPAFVLLYSLQSRHLLGTDEAAVFPAAAPADPPEPRANHDARKPQVS